MTKAFSNLPKIGVGVAKRKKKEFDNNSSTSKKKRFRLQHICKNYFGSDSIQEHVAATLTPKPLLKLKQIIEKPLI